MIAAVVQVSKLVWKLKTLRLSHSPTPSYGSPWVVAESSLVSSLRVAMSPLGVSFTDGDVVFSGRLIVCYLVFYVLYFFPLPLVEDGHRRHMIT